ncbi:MAG TPA: hypothetical protein VFL98_03415 [Candidatus Paceibacterota bacterium]|nr:hypothetical protein [Candidatus Paceibacterota bacterium]
MEKNGFLRTIRRVPPGSQVELIQLWHGDRPVAEVTVPHGRERDFAAIADALRQLQTAGFHFLPLAKADATVSRCFVSHEKDLVQKALEAARRGDHRQFGEMMGFPASAIDAFVHKEAMLSEEDISASIGFRNWHFHLRFAKAHPEDMHAYLARGYAHLLDDAPDLMLDMLPKEEDPRAYLASVRQFVGA